MPAIFTVDPHTGVPIYLQLIEQVKRSVALGVLAPGERLPTVKQLATDLTINPNTVARAYRDLERDGVIETSVGRGSFVSQNGVGDRAAAALADVASSTVDAAVREAKSMGLKRGQVRDIFSKALERWYSPDSDAKEHNRP
ncbi:MAG TPA: GntR family transcriptional regulator [Candidatus Eremiobacteraceae bacterium]|nr:GntR family transcriptional regulator [Candidatus Eremiobacteraceae bacterium]